MISCRESPHLYHSKKLQKKGSGKELRKIKKVEKVPQTFSIFPPLHSSNSLGDCWRLQIKETRFPSLGYLWSLKSEQRCQATTASYCYFYQASKAGQCLSSLFFGLFLKQFLDQVFHSSWFCFGGEALGDLALSVDDKFCEVPFDAFA